MRKLLLVGIVVLLLTSCFKKKNAHNNQVTDNLTPEVLDESDSYVSKRYKEDIITELFDEAINKDAKLKAFVTRMKDLNNWERDRLEAYNKFTSNNREYWAASRYLLEEIKDSTLKKQYKKLFADLKTKQLQLASEIDTAASILNKKQQLFNDYYLLVKLMVTQQRMQNYQQNEMPNVKPIEEVIHEYDSLIIVSKSLIKK